MWVYNKLLTQFCIDAALLAGWERVDFVMLNLFFKRLS